MFDVADGSIRRGLTAFRANDKNITCKRKHINSTLTQALSNTHTATEYIHSAACIRHGYHTVIKKKKILWQLNCFIVHGMTWLSPLYGCSLLQQSYY